MHDAAAAGSTPAVLILRASRPPLPCSYYNPIPHFGYDLALAHSPQLRNVPELPRDTGLGCSGSGVESVGGLSALL